MTNNELEIVMMEGLVVETIGDETAVTIPNGDIAVLNMTAGWILSQVSESGISPNALIWKLAKHFGISHDSAIKSIAAVIDRFVNLGIVRLRSPQREPSRRQLISTLPDYVSSILVAMREAEGVLGPHVDMRADALNFRDALGNEIEIPRPINRIAPCGPFAQALVESVSPSLIVGVNARGMHASAAHASKHPALRMGDSRIGGRFGRDAENAIGADVMLDVGTRLSRLHQANHSGNGVPVVHLVVPFGALPYAYRQLYRLTGLSKALELAALSEAVLAMVCRGQTEKPARVFFAQDKEGLSTRGRGTLVDEMLVSMGIENVAHNLAPDDCRDLSYRDIASMRPDVVVLLSSKQGDEKMVRQLNEAASCPAIVVPRVPFPWVDRSPLAMQTIGALWIARVVRGDDAESELDEAIVMCLDKFFGIDKSIWCNLKDSLKRQELCSG